jgi:hypothetical protein
VVGQAKRLPDSGPGWFKTSIQAVARHAGLPAWRFGDVDGRWWRRAALGHFDSCDDEMLRDELGFTDRGIKRFRDVVRRENNKS